MAALREVFARFSVSFDTKALDRAQGAITAVRDSLELVEIGIQKVQGAVHFLVGDIVESSVELDRQAARLGVSVEAMQALGHAATLSGKGLEDMVDAMSTLQERARDALIDPQSDPAEQLRLLGISATDSAGNLKDAETLIGEVADGLQGMENQTDRVGAAMTLFGDVGRELLPTLQGGSEGLAAMGEEFRALGGGITQEAVDGSRDLTLAWNRLGVIFTSVRAKIALFVIPTLTRLSETLEHLLTNRAALNTFKVAITAVAAVLTVHFLPAITASTVAMVRFLAPWAPLILAGAAFYLIVQDIFTALDGGPSIFGSLTDAMNDFFDMNRNGHGPLMVLSRIWEGLVRGMERAFNIADALIHMDLDRIRNYVPAGTPSARRGNPSGIGITADGRVTSIPQGAAVPRASAARRGAAGGGGGATINQTNNVTVTGAPTPEAVARVVDDRMERANRRAVENLEGRAR